MEHRGGVGYEKNTGDGAGILTGLPHALLQDIAQQIFDQALPDSGAYGVGNVFLPTDAAERAHCKEVIAEEIAAAGKPHRLARCPPMQTADVGKAARAAMPHFEQLFIARAMTGRPSVRTHSVLNSQVVDPPLAWQQRTGTATPVLRVLTVCQRHHL